MAYRVDSQRQARKRAAKGCAAKPACAGSKEGSAITCLEAAQAAFIAERERGA